LRQTDSVFAAQGGRYGQQLPFARQVSTQDRLN